MGVSGRINGNIGNLAHSTDYAYYIQYSEGNYNINANTSPVTAIVYIECYNHSAYDYSRTFTTTLNIAGKSFSKSITGMSLSPGTKIELCRGTYDVPHNSDGSKIAYISASTPTLPTGGGYGPNSGNASNNITLTTIPRASKVSLSSTNFTIGTTVRINTNRVTSSFTHKAKITFNGKTLSDKNNIGSYLDWNTSDLFPLMTDKVESTGTVTLYTYSGSTQIGNPTSINFTANARNQKPTFTNFQYEDTNSTILALTGNNQKIVSRYSNIKVKIPISMRMIPKNSATGREYQVFTQNNFSFSLKYFSTAEVSRTINNFNSNQLNVIAFDSRGNSTNVIKQLNNNIISYEELKLTSNFKLERTNFIGNTINITGGGTWKNVNFGRKTNSIKTMTIQIQNTSGTWSQVYDIKNLFTINSNGTWYNKTNNEFSSFNFVFGVEYNVKIIIKDELSTITINTKVNGGNVLLDALKGYGVSIGGIFNKSKGIFQVHKDTDELLDLNSNGDLNIKGKVTSNNGLIIKRPDGTTLVDGSREGLLSYLSREVSGNDWNTACAILSGLYMGSSMSNKPDNDQWHFVHNIAHNSLYKRQIAYDFFNDNIYARRCENGNWKPWRGIQTCTILYSNASGTTGTVTLSETAANFDYIEIYYTNNGQQRSMKVNSPNGKVVMLDNWVYEESTTYLFTRINKITISGTTITRNLTRGCAVNGAEATFTNEYSTFAITKVVGYR